VRPASRGWERNALAHRLKTEGFQVEVRFTIFYDTGQQEDWSDALQNQLKEAA